MLKSQQFNLIPCVSYQHTTQHQYPAGGAVHDCL